MAATVMLAILAAPALVRSRDTTHYPICAKLTSHREPLAARKPIGANRSGAEDAIIVRTIAFVAAASAGLALGNHAIAASSSYDGLWHVSIVTNKGECNSSYHYPVRIANGALSNADATGFAITGQVHDSGQVSVTVISNKGRATGNGHLSGRAGNGRWHGEKCSGSWTAQRGSTGRIAPY